MEKSKNKKLKIALTMGIICWVTHGAIEGYVNDQTFYSLLGKAGVPLGRAIKMSFLLAEGVAVVMIAARVFRLKEANEVIELFTEKLKNKLRPNST